MEKAALGAAATYTTPRTLLSILRLSQALAKLRFSNLVEQVRWSMCITALLRHGFYV